MNRPGLKNSYSFFFYATEMKLASAFADVKFVKAPGATILLVNLIAFLWYQKGISQFFFLRVYLADPNIKQPIFRVFSRLQLRFWL
jgi:hypothetical protein